MVTLSGRSGPLALKWMLQMQPVFNTRMMMVNGNTKNKVSQTTNYLIFRDVKTKYNIYIIYI